ncbi:hypothetical protein PIB30_048246 [Stylosanthes scabra]|uniref:Uncharacterized protein n=1 Tax=Stylosanthes scabra TaxID=79078 RepID=A0ABU6XEP6_9FABA|nr:hypothetical protein [Stylosanthes scabra]
MPKNANAQMRQLLFSSLLISIGFVVDVVDLSARVWKAAGGDGDAYGGSGQRRRGALGESVLESDVSAMGEDFEPILNKAVYVPPAFTGQ